MKPEELSVARNVLEEIIVKLDLLHNKFLPYQGVIVNAWKRHAPEWMEEVTGIGGINIPEKDISAFIEFSELDSGSQLSFLRMALDEEWFEEAAKKGPPEGEEEADEEEVED